MLLATRVMTTSVPDAQPNVKGDAQRQGYRHVGVFI